MGDPAALRDLNRRDVQSECRPRNTLTAVLRNGGAAVAVALLLAGCSSGFDQYFGTDKPPPAPADPKVATEGATPEATDPPGTEQPYPNLGSVPQTRPIRQSQESQRQEVAKGLVADRQNARYTDEVIRRDPVQGTAVARAGAAPPKLPTVPGGPPQPAQLAKAEPVQSEAAKPAGAEGKPAAATPGPAPSGLPQPSLPTALPARAPAAVPVSPPSAPVPVVPSAPALPAPPATRQTEPTPTVAQAEPPRRSNLVPGTAVAQAIGQAPPPAPPPPAPAAAAPPLDTVPRGMAQPVSPPPAAPPPVLPAPPSPAAVPAAPAAASVPPALAQAPTAPPPPALPAGAASIYQPPSVAPTPAAPSMASVAQAQFQPPPPPTIPGRPPLAQLQAATGVAPAAQPVPQPTAPPATGYTPPGAPAVTAPAYPQAGYPPQPQQPLPQPLQPQQQQQQQIAALPPAMQRPVLTPPPGYGLPPSANALAAAPSQPPLPAPTYPYATATTSSGAVLNPIRPPPPPISPALPQLASRGGSPIDEARMRAAAGVNDAAAVAEARRRAAFASGQQVALILFNDGSASLGAGDRDLLQRVAAMARQTGAVVRVVGHASGGAGDSRGANRAGNFAISQARADAAAAELAAAGLPPDRVVVEARGDSEPVYRETSPAGAAGNRRVDVYLQ